MSADRDAALARVAAMARQMRRKILDLSYACNSNAHIGGGLSMVEIMATLYGAVLRYDTARPEWDARDRFILSKGHGVLGYFTALNAAGFISDETLATFKHDESDLIAHPVMNLPLGIESSNGSLGHGLSLGVGLALAGRMRARDHRVFVYLGDGECNEGSVWEAAMSAAHFRLDRLCAVIDHNGMQSDGEAAAVMDLGDLSAKWASFGWTTREVDGHDVAALLDVFALAPAGSRPTAVIARTVKGKGIAFMENNNEWHHARLTKALYDRACEALESR
jgi:transketolase